MATTRYQNNDMRRQVGSPRPKGRSENRDTLCRNVLIYGHCRYEDQGCTFNHDPNRGKSTQPEIPKKTLNVESPSFTPATQSTAAKKATIPSQAANAPSFTPRGLGAATPVTTQAPPEPEQPTFNPATVREFTPSFDHSAANGAAQDATVSYDAFSMTAVGQNLTATTYNPYADDHNAMAGAGHTFYQPPGAFTTPLQPLHHHLYAPVGPSKEDLLPYQRSTSQLFMPESVRQDIVKKAEATLQILPNSQLPQLEHYHSLVPLDTTQRKNPSLFGYPTWVYKATSTKTGHMLCLRRLESFRLTNEKAIIAVKEWRKVISANVVRIHDAFTTRAFGDSSLVFVQDYHPLSRTLADIHFGPASTQAGRYQQKTPISEAILWSYISQIATALKAIHSLKLAARCLDPSKIILTHKDKNRIRLNSCSILDVVNFDNRKTVQELQQEDLVSFGRLILGLATGTHPSHISNMNLSIEQMSRIYPIELRDTVYWLLTPAQASAQKSIDEFLRGIATRIVATFDDSERKADEDYAILFSEVENGRIARLLMKLGTINERYEYSGDPMWSENGDRYILKLFRDYVFHQVDRDGNPVLDMAHMLRCLNRLDVGTDERVCLTSRDEQTAFVVSYRELKKQLNAAFGDLQKAGKPSTTIS